MKQIMVKSKHCIGCKSCELACAVAHSKSKNILEAISEIDLPQSRISVIVNQGESMILNCRHCSDAPCLNACAYTGIYLDEYTQLMQVDTSTCVGCMLCVEACPYGALSSISYEKKIVKCDRCRDSDYIPACITSCPTKALSFIEV